MPHTVTSEYFGGYQRIAVSKYHGISDLHCQREAYICCQLLPTTIVNYIGCRYPHIAVTYTHDSKSPRYFSRDIFNNTMHESYTIVYYRVILILRHVTTINERVTNEHVELEQQFHGELTRNLLLCFYNGNICDSSNFRTFTQ